jgi:hypothetical protein
MNRFFTRMAVVVASALLLGGCATTSAPDTLPGSDASSYRASPATSSSGGFASPRNLLEMYPEMRRQGP